MPRYFRKVLKISAEQSPNVRLARAQQASGLTPTDEVIVPGVLTWGEYQQRRATWDPIRACVGLDADFYEGAQVLLFPPLWLNAAEERARQLAGSFRKARAIGIDPAEGGDQTAMAAIDEWGLIELVSRKTPDTSLITGEALAFMRKHGVPAESVVFDRGGGGKQHADALRSQGHNVRTVAFGESLVLDPKRGLTMLEERLDNREERYAYRNRRAEMYGELRQLLDTSINPNSFGLPAEYTELRHELAPMPLLWDNEGRMRMLPKQKKDPTSKEKTLTELIGHSPDSADSLVLAVHGMLHKAIRITAGAAV